MPTGIGLIAEVFGVVLIVLGVLLASIADDLLFVVAACFLQFMGEVFVLLIVSGPSAATATLVLGAGSLAILIGGKALRPGPNGRASPRAFDLTVAALAVAGAAGLAATHPPLPNLLADVAFVTLILAGLLFCLLGGNARLACGLIFLTSGAGLLLQIARPDLGFGERVLLAATQLCLVLALSALWTVGEDPNRPPARRRVRSSQLADASGGDSGPGSAP
jgi:hypothetical protein